MRISRLLGAATMGALAVTAITGVGLAFHYVPSTTLAHDSIRALEQDVPSGILLRAVHYNGTHVTVALTLAWLLMMVIERAHRPPRHGIWFGALGLLLTLFAFGVTGELLPYDERAYAATQVRAEILGRAPVVGETVRQAMLGGDTVGGTTLTRFHFLHVAVLPLIATLLWLLLRGTARAMHAIDEIEGRAPASKAPKALAACAASALVLLLGWWQQAPLGVVADPGDPGFEARPEWYFLWLNQLLHHAKGNSEVLVAFWLPNLLLAGAFLLPLLDRTRFRRPMLGIIVLLLLGIAALSAMALSRPLMNRPNLDYTLGTLDSQLREGYLQIRRNNCLDCHKYQHVGTTEHDAPDLEKTGDMSLAELDELLIDPPPDMPAYDHVPAEARRQMALYLQWLSRQR